MAPPIPGLQRPAVRSRRSAGDVLAGLLAVVVLIALIGGVPFGLLTVFGSPIPHTVPTMSALTHQITASAVLKVLAVVVWLAWVQLILCVVAEIRAAARNSGMPARVPLAGGTQAAVHRLVTAAALLFTAAAALSPALIHQAPSVPLPVVAAAAHAPAQAAGHEAGRGAAGHQAAAGHQLGAEKFYVVRPPVGRYHQSLWEIAQDHLGDGRRYGEIFELNKDRLQPDGTKLTIASLIRPGWILRMPHDAHGAGIEIVRPHDGNAHSLIEQRADQDAAAHRSAGHDVTSQAGHSAAGQEGAGQDGSGQHVTAPAAGSHRDGDAGRHGDERTGAGHVAPGHGSLTPPGPGGRGLTFPDELAAASLLAAGVLAALGRRRREQLWRRAFGRRVAVPEPAAALAETALRLGASEPSARLLDAGLRYLSVALAEQGQPLPNAFAAHISEQSLDLWVAPTEAAPPAPWISAGDGQLWRLPVAALPGLDPVQAGAALAPYPGLVSVGTDDAGRVLVDLEAAQGLIAVTGPADMVQAALAAVAVELATNRWSDRMQVILVGFGTELPMLAPDRVTAVPTLAEALPGLQARATAARAALAAAGTGSVLTGRSLGGHPDIWAPQYLISAIPPTAAERDALRALSGGSQRSAAGYVIAGEVPGATWTWQVSPAGELHAGPLGLDVRAQLLPPAQYAAVVELFRAAGEPVGELLSPPQPTAAPAAQLVPGAQLPVEIALLGPAAVRAPGVIEPERAAQATEVLAYLAMHPGGVHPRVLAGAIWPRGVTGEVQEATLRRVQRWLGRDAAGLPQLTTGPDGRLLLGPEVRVDWRIFQALVAHATAESGRGGQEEVTWLGRALDEVRGPLLGDHDAARYTWLAAEGLDSEVAAAVADAAHRLSGRRRADDDPAGAMSAARAGLRLAPDDELLWRDLLLGAEASGDEQLLRAAVDEACTRAATDDVLPKMAPQTEALIDELLPSWRSSVA